MSANLGNSKAMYHLGLLCQAGALGKVDLTAAVNWFVLSAKKGHAKAIQDLEKLSSSSELSDELKLIIERHFEEPETGTDVNSDDSAPKPKQSAQPLTHDNPLFRYGLGKQYKEGTNEKPKDVIRAAFWFRKAANKGHTQAEFELAQLYYSGQLGEKTRPVSVNIFKQAAKAKHLSAAQTLITIYSDGFLMKPDPKKASKWQAREKMLLARESSGLNSTPAKSI